MKKGKNSPTQTVSLDKPLDISEIKTETAVAVKEIQQSLKKRVSNAKKNIEKYTTARIDDLVAEIEDLVKTKRHELVDQSTKVSRMNGRQITVQLADLEQSIAQPDLSPEDRKYFQAMKKDLQHDLPLILNRELFVWFQGELNKLRAELELVRPSVAHAELVVQSAEHEGKLRRQIASLKGYEDVSMLKGDLVKELELCATIPKATRELLFHPVWLSRKLEKEFTCIVDKSRDVHSKSDGCYIAGTARDVDACAKKLETLDFVSGRNHIILDGKTLGQVMGPGGSNAFEIEKECGVILHAPAGGVELTIYGSEKNVAKAMAKIGDIKSARVVDGTTGGMVNVTADRLRCNTAVAKAFHQLDTGVEEKCGVSITVSPLVEEPRDSWMIVRGLPENVARAIHDIQLGTKRMHLETLEVADLFDGNAKEAELAIEKVLISQSGSRKGMGEVKLMMRFSDLRKKAVFVRVAETTQVDCVCMHAEDVEFAQKEFEEILKKSLFITERIELAHQHNRCWNEGICAQVANVAGGKEGMMLFLRRSDSNEVSLELWGSDRAVSNARRFVEEVHDAKIISVPEKTVKPMLENKCQVLQSLQEEAVVSAFFSKFDLELWLYGLDANKRAGSKLFDKFVDSVHQAMLQHTVKTIPIARDEIGRLIGPKGRVMNGIKERSDLEEIRISEAEKKVYLTGSNSSIDHAVSLIEEELSARKDPSVVQIGLAETEETVRILQNLSSGAKASEKVNVWVSSVKEEKPQEAPVVDSQDLFPLLGAAPASAKPKWKKR